MATPKKKVGANGLGYVLPKQKALPYTPFDVTTDPSYVSKSAKINQPDEYFSMIDELNKQPTLAGSTTASANPAQAATFSSGLFGSDPTLNSGAFNSDDMSKYLSSSISDKAMAGEGVGQYNGTLNGVQTQFTNDNLHTADAGSIKSASLDGTTYGGSGGQWVNGLSNYEALQGVAGLGNLGMSLYGMFGENGTNAVNKKNMQLMDQQIANNKDIMKTRTERAGDIKKYFG